MTNTQQEWLEKQLQSPMPNWSYGPMMGPTGAKILASGLTSAWPSSPQGLAVKRLVEALTKLRDIVVEREQGNHDLDAELDAADTALDATRKAGLG